MICFDKAPIQSHIWISTPPWTLGCSPEPLLICTLSTHAPLGAERVTVCKAFIPLFSARSPHHLGGMYYFSQKKKYKQEEAGLSSIQISRLGKQPHHKHLHARVGSETLVNLRGCPQPALYPARGLEPWQLLRRLRKVTIQ